MGRAWLTIAGADSSASGSSIDLKPGLTVLGGARGDVAVPASGTDCVHLWSDPPKLIFVGKGDPPLVNGKPAPDLSLHSGDRIEWRGFAATFGCDEAPERLEEIPAAWMKPAGGAGASLSGVPPWSLVKAGLVADLSLGDAALVKRVQDAAARGEFDAASVSRDLLAAAPELRDDDPRLAERSARLMRELLMAPVTKRPARPAATERSSGCFTFLLTQFLILILLTLIVIAALLVARTRFRQSIDVQLDRLITLIAH